MIGIAFIVASAPAAAEFNAAGELLRVVLSLAGIIVLIFAAGWFSRRMQRTRGAGGRRIRCVESFAIGSRERIVLLEADGQRLLVGTSPGGMRTLHVYPVDAADASTATSIPAPVPFPVPAFGELLARWKRRA